MESEKGFSLIEVVIAMALMGVVAAAFLSGLSTTSRGVSIADERATAESLARSQMEYVKNQGYDATNDPPQYSEILPPAGYNIEFLPPPERLDPEGDGILDDDGIQKITVTVYFPSYDAEHPDRKITLEGYKINR